MSAITVSFSEGLADPTRRRVATDGSVTREAHPVEQIIHNPDAGKRVAEAVGRGALRAAGTSAAGRVSLGFGATTELAESLGRGSATLAVGTALAIGGGGVSARSSSAADASGAAGALARDFMANPPASTSPDARAPIPITHPIFAGAGGGDAFRTG